MGLVDMRSCPRECPYLVELEEHCQFRCVTANKCGGATVDREATIPDSQLGMCRRCNVPGCDHCDLSSPDHCLPEGCGYGYIYDGLSAGCDALGGPLVIAVKVFLALLVAYVVVWYCDLLLLRGAPNRQGAQEGLRFREATKLMRPAEPGGAGREHYSLCTNLQATANADIAGPGTILHFNFQLLIIVWALVLAGAWYAVAMLAEPDLLLVGLRAAYTPAWMCAVVFWGHEVQRQAMWVKVGFLAFAYVFSFVGAIAYSAVQLGRFRKMDDHTTMKDFMLLVQGLPKRLGSETSVEEDTKAFLEQATGQKLVGLSVCWDMNDQDELVYKAAEADVAEAEGPGRDRGADPRASGDGGSGGTPSDKQPERPRPGVARSALLRLDAALLGLHGVTPEEETRPEQIKSLLAGLWTSGYAFAVFQTEDSRDAALEAGERSRGFDVPGYPGARVTLTCEDVEPDSVSFAHMGLTRSQFVSNLVWGWLVVGIAQILWIACVYIPYAYYVATFSYAHGDEPDVWAKVILTLIVVMGNQIMYQVCLFVAQAAGFKFNDTTEVYYTMLYSVTCFVNILADLWITAVLAYRLMLAVDAHTVEGDLLAHLQSYHDIFDTFSMQRSLGMQAWLYNFPGTFLVPYLVEPFVAILLLRHLMVMIVTSHDELTPHQAEQALSIFVPMDMGRYADILLNVLLTTICFFFAPGFVLRTLLALAAAHCWVIVYDHYRVLRCVPSFCYASNVIDRFSQVLLGVPTGVILVALVVKSNCMSGPQEAGPLCVRDAKLLRRAALAFALHLAAYLLCYRCLASRPRFGSHHEKATDDYAALSAQTPASWFSANPVHCLRSKFVHEHDPPCVFHVRGKEHLLKANAAIACHFEKK